MQVAERDWNMQRDAILPAGLSVRHEARLFKRLLSKLVVDVLPAAVVSAIGGFMITQYQFSHIQQRPATVQVVPASAEMMQLVRDEHAIIVDYLKAQRAEEKNRNAAEDAADANARATADAHAATVAPATTEAPAVLPPARPAPTVIAARPLTHAKVAAAPAALPPHAPLVIAQADQPVAATPIASAPAEQKSLLTRTIEIKDHVVGATLHAVSAIGSIPSWIASLGDHGNGGDTAPASAAPAPRQFTS
jgi:hypothetical protein